MTEGKIAMASDPNESLKVLVEANEVRLCSIGKSRSPVTLMRSSASSVLLIAKNPHGSQHCVVLGRRSRSVLPGHGPCVREPEYSQIDNSQIDAYQEHPAAGTLSRPASPEITQQAIEQDCR